MSSGQSSSDPEIESVKPWVDLVNFHGLSPSYPRSSDILVKYTLGTAVAPSPHDWVGLFHKGWGTTEDYISYVWAPVKIYGNKLAYTYEVVFKAHQLQVIPVDDRKFQFLFVSRGNFVAGVSKSFALVTSDPEPQDGLSQHSSYSLVGSSVSLDTQGFEDLGESCNESSTSSSESFEMNCALDFIPNIPKCKECTKEELKCVHENHPTKFKTAKATPVVTENVVPTKRSYVDVLKSKPKNVKVTRDSTSLVGPFEDSSSVEKRLSFIQHHPILSEYIENKERLIVPYKRIYNINPMTSHAQTQVQPGRILMNNKIQPFADILTNRKPFHNSLQVEVLPCCALCSAANNLLEVYRRQLNMSQNELKDIKQDMVNLRKALEVKEAAFQALQRQQQKYAETDNTIEEVLIQMACLKNDISNLLLQNKQLEENKTQLQTELDSSMNNLAVSQAKSSNVENQLNDILFSLSLKGYNSVVDFSGTKINLSEVQGKETDVDGWQMYKNKRCGRLLAVINQQEKSIKSLQSALTERNDHVDKIEEELSVTEKQLQVATSDIQNKSAEMNDVKQSLISSLKREENTMRMLVDTESEITQYKYDAETREHYLLQEIEGLREELDVKRNSAMMSFTNRLVSTGLASVPDVCKSIWCAGLCPRAEKPQVVPDVMPQATQVNESQKHGVDTVSWETSVPDVCKSIWCAGLCPRAEKPQVVPDVMSQATQVNKSQNHGVDTVSWETEGPVAKQPKLNDGKKKASKRTHHEAIPKTKPQKPNYQRRTVFPPSCPVCGVSFANAIDNRVIDEHLAFHDIYRV